MKYRVAIVAGIALALSTAMVGCVATTTPLPTPTSTNSNKVDAAARNLVPYNIRLSGVLSVAVDDTYAPNEFKDATGQSIGWEVELLQAVAMRLGLSAKFESTSFDRIMPAVQVGDVNVGLSSFFDTPERRKTLDWVDYYTAGTLWAQRTGSTQVSPENACGLTVTVVQNTYQHLVDLPTRSRKCASQHRSPIKVVTYVKQDDATEAVILGRADAMLADSPVTLYAIRNSSGSLVAAGETYDVLKYGLAVQKDSTLSEALRLAVQDLIDDGEYRSILAAWGVEAGAIGKSTINGASN